MCLSLNVAQRARQSNQAAAAPAGDPSGLRSLRSPTAPPGLFAARPPAACSCLGELSPEVGFLWPRATARSPPRRGGARGTGCPGRPDVRTREGPEEDRRSGGPAAFGCPRPDARGVGLGSGLGQVAMVPVTQVLVDRSWRPSMAVRGRGGLRFGAACAAGRLLRPRRLDGLRVPRGPLPH